MRLGFSLSVIVLLSYSRAYGLTVRPVWIPLTTPTAYFLRPPRVTRINVEYESAINALFAREHSFVNDENTREFIAFYKKAKRSPNNSLFLISFQAAAEDLKISPIDLASDDTRIWDRVFSELFPLAKAHAAHIIDYSAVTIIKHWEDPSWRSASMTAFHNIERDAEIYFSNADLKPFRELITQCQIHSAKENIERVISPEFPRLDQHTGILMMSRFYGDDPPNSYIPSKDDLHRRKRAHIVSNQLRHAVYLGDEKYRRRLTTLLAVMAGTGAKDRSLQYSIAYSLIQLLHPKFYSVNDNTRLITGDILATLQTVAIHTPFPGVRKMIIRGVADLMYLYRVHQHSDALEFNVFEKEYLKRARGFFRPFLDNPQLHSLALMASLRQASVISKDQLKAKLAAYEHAAEIVSTEEHPLDLFWDQYPTNVILEPVVGKPIPQSLFGHEFYLSYSLRMHLDQIKMILSSLLVYSALSALALKKTIAQFFVFILLLLFA